MEKIPKKLGEILLDSKIITAQQLSQALKQQISQKKFLGQILVDSGFITIEKLESALAEQLSSRLAEILIKDKYITWNQLSFAIKVQQESCKPLGKILKDLGYIAEKDLIKAISEKYEVEYINLSEYKINLEAIKKLPKDLCKFHSILPIDIQDNTLIIAMADPGNIMAIDDARVVSGMNIKAVVASYDEIISYLK